MGTNYYFRTDACPCCGRSDNERHIGKSSGGWCFSLHVYPEDEINDLEDWIRMLEKDDGEIYDEYGGKVGVVEMLSIIRKRCSAEGFNSVPIGYSSWRSFHEENFSEPGPQGLLRHKVDGRHCIRQGKGTWDCIVGEFS